MTAFQYLGVNLFSKFILFSQKREKHATREKIYFLSEDSR